ncbi:MAG: dolichol-P-glucose synthetase [Hyphomonadaceae bacterium BRH_c29]|nr:MAG: dolichol-P-glucose synthetase [Hyphomonadaceae bacterium BRH_c29]
MQAPKADALELTILMPCLNEAETLAICIRKARAYLEQAGIKGEVLIADNGSTDGSREIAEAEGARVAPVAERGYGAALIGGIRAAHGKYIIMGDADDSYDFSNLDAFVQELRAGGQLVMGNRFKGGIAPGAMPLLHRVLGNPVLSFIGRLFFKIPVGDFHCGLRGFNRDAIRDLDLSSSGMEFASEMVVKASLNDLNMREVPTTLSPDGRTRAPHLRTWRDGWRHLRFLLLHSPKWLFAVPGSTLLGAGLVGVACLIGGPLEIAGIRLDVLTLVASCFSVIVGVQLLTFSLLTRVYAGEFGVLPKSKHLDRILPFLTLERQLQLAAVLCVGGLIGTGAAFSGWASSGFGDIVGNTTLRWFALSLTSVAISVQLAAAAFLASFIRLPRTGR